MKFKYKFKSIKEFKNFVKIKENLCELTTDAQSAELKEKDRKLYPNW